MDRICGSNEQWQLSDDKTDSYDQAALDVASREVHMMLLREGSRWGTKACEEMGRVFMTAYLKAAPLPECAALPQEAEINQKRQILERPDDKDERSYGIRRCPTHGGYGFVGDCEICSSKFPEPSDAVPECGSSTTAEFLPLRVEPVSASGTMLDGLRKAWVIVNGRKAGRDASDEIWRELTKIEHIIEQEETIVSAKQERSE